VTVAEQTAPPRGGAWPPDGPWPPWTAPVALIGGLVLAAVAGLVVDLPALALGVKLTSSHTPAGLTLADTFVQDLAFVAAAVYCAALGGRAVHSWQFGLIAPARGWRSAAGAILVLLAVFALVSVMWSVITSPGREKVLDTLGSSVVSAAVICIVAPMCEEMLFRGYIFPALRNWRGTLGAAAITAVLFGGVHAGSAPVLDLVPLAFLGFGLCLLYTRTGSLFPCMAAHSLNNSVAFASLAGYTALEGSVLAVGALAGIVLVVAICRRVGLIGAQAPAPGPGA
jgi:uncharacterized protein